MLDLDSRAMLRLLGGGKSAHAIEEPSGWYKAAAMTPVSAFHALYPMPVAWLT